MKIVVAGCGKIGQTVIGNLVAEGHDLVAIDSDNKILDELTNIYDIMVICGNCADSDVLEEVSINEAELFVALTGSDELNMLSCFIAKRMGCNNTIARIRNPEYNDDSLVFLRKELGLSLSINPDMLTASELFNILKLPSALKIEHFSRRNFEMIELIIKSGSDLDGVKLADMKGRYGSKVLICAVQRGEDVYIPDGNFVLQAGDRISVSADHSDISKLLKSLSIHKKQSKNVMILGGSKSAFYLAKMLINSGASVKIIEKNPARCEEFCEKLPQAMIIQGDGAQQELLLEEGLRSMDAFVALTGMDEENILVSIYAAANSVPTVISKVNRNELATMGSRLGLNCIVSPKNITADIFVRYARALENSMGSNVETLYKIMDGKAEALEFRIQPESSITGLPLKDFNFKKNILIAGIIRGKKIIIPGGDDVILGDDKVIVVSKDHKLNDIEDILG
ncbi:MAG: Trk system potassium transporter TrkA [Clostridia bacterium]|nr:Trk system potassium transporter TrkA [Clostridia bacterium]